MKTCTNCHNSRPDADVRRLFDSVEICRTCESAALVFCTEAEKTLKQLGEGAVTYHEAANHLAVLSVNYAETIDAKCEADISSVFVDGERIVDRRVERSAGCDSKYGCCGQRRSSLRS